MTLQHEKLFGKDYAIFSHSFFMNNPSFYNLLARLAQDNFFKGDYSNKKVIEIGCGLGQNIYLLPNRAGFDVAKFSLDYCNKKGIKTYSSFNNIPNNYFDEILLCETLEHIPNPHQMIKNLRKKLKRGGLLKVVNKRITYDYVKLPFKKEAYGHLYGWSFFELNNLLEVNGFKVVYNKKIYSKGLQRLYFLSKVNYRLYKFLLQFFGFLFKDFDIFVIAKKE